MFSNLTYEDKQAFFSLLDEYFESRPHLVGGGSGAQDGITIKPAHAMAAASAMSSAYNANNPGGRQLPPIGSASRSNVTPPYTPASPETASPHNQQSQGQKSLNSARGMMSTSMNKVTSNSHVSSALGKVGAGGLTNKFNKPYTPQSNASPDRERTMPPAPPTSRGGGAAGLTSGRSFGHVDTSSGGAAFKSMWSDPKKAGPPPVDTSMHPALTNSRSPLPPPVRHGGAGSPAAPAHPQAQALYDYAGGDSTDLPVNENQIVKIVDKASDDWWTCEDDDGKQGLVPANYLKEL